jgi:hypothetical protein
MNEATPKTKKQVILIKLKNLEKKVKPFCKSEQFVFPSIEDIDVVDFLFYFNFLFPNGSNYSDTIKQIITTKDVLIDNENINTVIDLIVPFVEWLKKIN